MIPGDGGTGRGGSLLRLLSNNAGGIGLRNGVSGGNGRRRKKGSLKNPNAKGLTSGRNRCAEGRVSETEEDAWQKIKRSKKTSYLRAAFPRNFCVRGRKKFLTLSP